MAKRKLIIILFLISTLWILSSADFNRNIKQDYMGASKSLMDSVKAGIFQNLLDDYCEEKSAKFQVEVKLKNLKDQKGKNDSIIAAEVLELKKYTKTRKRIIFKSKINLDVFAKDSLRKAKTRKRKSGILMYDSLIYEAEQNILFMRKQNNDFANEIDSLQIELAKRKISFDNEVKVIARYASEIHGALSFNLCGVRYNVFVAAMDSEEIRIHLFKKDGQNFLYLDSVYSYLESKNIDPLMVTNAGMFTPSHEPQGLYIEEGSKVQYKLDRSKKNIETNFHLYPNGVFFIDVNNIPYVETTDNFFKLQNGNKLKIKLATQSGPMLVINGKIHSKFKQGSTNLKIRSGVGKIDDHKVIFAITLDESNFYEFACLFRDIFNCKDALFLDGAISQMYIKGINTHPINYNFGPIISISKKF